MAAKLPEPLLGDLGKVGLKGVWHRDIDSVPGGEGAYALAVHIDKPVKLRRPAGQTQPLPPGWYIYAGSARGPGGLQGRLKRHFARRKRQHWHIDQLTSKASAIAALTVVKRDECDLVSSLFGSYAFDMAVPGFGNSDCQMCTSHLLVWRNGAGKQA